MILPVPERDPIRTIRKPDFARLDFASYLQVSPQTRAKFPGWPDPAGGWSNGESWINDSLHDDPLHRGSATTLSAAAVAEQLDSIVGVAGVRGTVDGNRSDLTHVELHGPVVAREKRRQGFGAELLTRMMQIAAENFDTRRIIYNGVAVENDAGRVLLGKFGFAGAGARDICYRLTTTPESIALPAGFRVRLSNSLDAVEKAYSLYLAVWSGKKSIASFIGDVAVPPSCFVTLLRGEEVVGFFEHIATPTDNNRIEYFALREDLRGRGIGTAFLSTALGIVWRSASPRTLNLTASEDNAAAMRVYRRLGFVELFRLETLARTIGEAAEISA